MDNTKTRANQIKNDTVKAANNVKDNVIKKATDVKNNVVKTATGLKNDVVDMAKELKDDAIQIANDTKDKYEQAKDGFTKRKNDTLLKVLMAGGNFSKQLLEKIGNAIYTKQEQLQIKNEQIAQRNGARKENENRQVDTMEM